MGFFDFLKSPDIDQGVKEYRAVPGAILLDVRTPQEYREGHVPGSVNVPLDTLSDPKALPVKKDAPVFVYCHSGARSSRAVRILNRMGYANTKNIGGIAAYSGKVEH